MSWVLHVLDSVGRQEVGCSGMTKAEPVTELFCFCTGSALQRPSGLGWSKCSINGAWGGGSLPI